MLDISNLGYSDIHHLHMHRSNQRLRASALLGHYISSAYTGYRWKGDRIKQYFETIVYRFRSNHFTFEREIFSPVVTYTYRTYKECIKHHDSILEAIRKNALVFEEK